jgi:hypothetical protein
MQKRPRKNATTVGLIKLDHVCGAVRSPAILARLYQPKRKDSAGRSARNQVEKFMNGPTRAPLNFGEDYGRNYAPDASAVDA